ncbi:MAG: hypothetical protein V3U09_00115, partial [Thermoplasmata archaeon]
AVVGTTSWSYEWATTDIANGHHTVSARAFDGSNHSSEVVVDVTVNNAPSSKPLLEELWFWILITILLIVAIGILFIAVRRRMGTEAPQEEDDIEEDGLNEEDAGSQSEDNA